MLGGPGVYLEEFLCLEPGAAWRLWEGPQEHGGGAGSGHSWHTCALAATLGSDAPARVTALCSLWPLEPWRRGKSFLSDPGAPTVGSGWGRAPTGSVLLRGGLCQ